MNDYLVRVMSKTGNIRALACTTRHLVHEACQRHGTSLTATIALGRALSGAALMGAQLKDHQRVALKFEGNGPLKKIIVEADSEGVVRGYVGVPDAEIPLNNRHIDVASAIGKAGFLTVTKDLRLKEPYKGVVQLYTSEIGEDLAYYLTESEQIPSAVGVGVFVESDGQISAAGGFLIQSLPPADDAAIEKLIGHIRKMPPLTELLRQHTSPEQLLEQIFQDIPTDLLGQHPLKYQCSCSKKRMEQALISLGSKELSQMLHEKHETIVTCEFCRTQYHFTREQLQNLIQQIQ